MANYSKFLARYLHDVVALSKFFKFFLLLANFNKRTMKQFLPVPKLPKILPKITCGKVFHSVLCGGFLKLNIE